MLWYWDEFLAFSAKDDKLGGPESVGRIERCPGKMVNEKKTAYK